MTTERQNPRYHGLHKHVDKEGGYAFWVPAGWHRTDMDESYHGVIYSPNADSTAMFYNTMVTVAL